MKKKKFQIDYFILLIVLIIGIGIGSFFDTHKTIYEITSPEQEFSRSQINLVAIDDDGYGIGIPLRVEARIGNGKVLTNIDKLLFWIDTQFSIQTAKEVAENITQVNTDDFDLMYTIEAKEAGIVGGPSAGAALAIATIGALRNQTFADDIMITGTIESDGSIGRVSGILEKAQAAKQAGATLFLVPKGQGTEIKFTPVEECETRENLIFCRTNYEKQVINIGQNTGISIIEVENIEEAIKYFY